METTKDKYDEAVEYLTANPEEIQDAWGRPDKHPAGCLFGFTGPTINEAYTEDGQFCGCLTQVSAGVASAFTAGLTRAIRSDDRIPSSQASITVDLLPAFAEWQRRLDRELGRN